MTRPPDDDRPYYALNGPVQHLTTADANRLVRLAYRVARGPVDASAIEEARRLVDKAEGPRSRPVEGPPPGVHEGEAGGGEERSLTPFCKGCGAKIEWHPRVVGTDIAINPEPHPDGMLAFTLSMKLERLPKGTRPKMYQGHLLTCPSPEKARAAPPSVSTCDVEDCERTDRHFHCWECGEAGHFADDCPDGE